MDELGAARDRGDLEENDFRFPDPEHLSEEAKSSPAIPWLKGKGSSRKARWYEQVPPPRWKSDESSDNARALPQLKTEESSSHKSQFHVLRRGTMNLAVGAGSAAILAAVAKEWVSAEVGDDPHEKTDSKVPENGETTSRSRKRSEAKDRRSRSRSNSRRTGRKGSKSRSRSRARRRNKLYPELERSRASQETMDEILKLQLESTAGGD